MHEDNIESLWRKVMNTSADNCPMAFAKELVTRAVQAERKDAERYRWLRRNPQWLGWEHDFRPDEVEREIDAAMRSNAPLIGGDSPAHRADGYLAGTQTRD